MKKLHIDPKARRLLTVRDAHLKSAGKTEATPDAAGNGWVEGYAAVWDNVDGQSEIMKKGCFSRSIQQAIPAGNVKLMVTHFCNGGDVLECIGTVKEAKEDDVGLWIRAEFAGTDDAQAVRKKITEGHVKGLSVGYVPVRWEVKDEERENGEFEQIVTHLECKFLEVTVTVRPANELAEISGAKTLQTLNPASPVTGKTDSAAPGATPSTPTPEAVLPPDQARVRRELAIKRARLSLLAHSM